VVRTPVAPAPTLAIIGAGGLGRGIAYAAALGGCRTILEDLLPNALRKAEYEIRSHLDQALILGEISGETVEAVLGRLESAGSVEKAAREADFIIETVPDELESKIEIFTLLDKICRPHTILASSTACLSVVEIAAVTYRPGKCIAMRFVNPVHKMKRLEIIRTPGTDDETVAAAFDLGRRMGKEVSVMQEVPS